MLQWINAGVSCDCWLLSVSSYFGARLNRNERSYGWESCRNCGKDCDGHKCCRNYGWEVLTSGEDWPYDPERKAMRTKRKGHKCDRILAEKRENTAKLMLKMPQMLLDYKKRRWENKMKEEEKAKEDK